MLGEQQSDFVMRTAILLIIYSFVSLNAFAQQPYWYSTIKELNLLSSSKQDVIHTFGLEKAFAIDPEYYQRSQWYFDLEGGGSIEANFWDRGPCHGVRADRHGFMYWNVADGTLIGIFFSPGKINISLDQLPFSTAVFEANEEYQPRSRYFSRKLGIQVEADGTKRVHQIYFGPPSSMEYLLCPL
jgi:hypothetical protein